MSTCQSRSSLSQYIPGTETQNQHGQPHKSQLKTGHDPAKSRHICALDCMGLHVSCWCWVTSLGSAPHLSSSRNYPLSLHKHTILLHRHHPTLPRALLAGPRLSPPLVTACAHLSPLTPLSPLHWSPPSPLLASVHVPRALPGSQLSTVWAGGR